MSGTSMAAPYVAGSSPATSRRTRPALPPVRAGDARHRHDLEAAGRDNDTGYGLIDAYELLAATLRARRPPSPRSRAIVSATVSWSAAADQRQPREQLSGDRQPRRGYDGDHRSHGRRCPG